MKNRKSIRPLTSYAVAQSPAEEKAVLKQYSCHASKIVFTVELENLLLAHVMVQ